MQLHEVVRLGKLHTGLLTAHGTALEMGSWEGHCRDPNVVGSEQRNTCQGRHSCWEPKRTHGLLVLQPRPSNCAWDASTVLACRGCPLWAVG